MNHNTIDDGTDWCEEPPCHHPDHNPPTHLYIPPGSKHVHQCPGCKKTITIRTSHIWMHCTE
jgi:hypothetical protein